MNAFAEKIIQAMLSWTQSIYAWFWDNAASEEPSASADWFMNNWVKLVIAIIIAGFVIDFVVWLIRYKPYRAWIAFIRKIAGRRSAPKDIAFAPPAAPPANADQDDKDIPDSLLPSVQAIVNRAHENSPPLPLQNEPRTQRPREKTETPPAGALLKTRDLVDTAKLPPDAPLVHLRNDPPKNDELPETYVPVSEGSLIERLVDSLHRGARVVRRSLRTARLRLRLLFSRGKNKKN